DGFVAGMQIGIGGTGTANDIVLVGGKIDPAHTFFIKSIDLTGQTMTLTTALPATYSGNAVLDNLTSAGVYTPPSAGGQKTTSVASIANPYDNTRTLSALIRAHASSRRDPPLP